MQEWRFLEPKQPARRSLGEGGRDPSGTKGARKNERDPSTAPRARRNAVGKREARGSAQDDGCVGGQRYERQRAGGTPALRPESRVTSHVEGYVEDVDMTGFA